MASTFRANATVSWAGSTTGTITLPGTVATGDWGLLVVASSAPSASSVITTPSGWTVLVAQTDFGTGSYAVYKRQVVGGDTTVDIVKDNTGTAMVANAVWYYGGEGYGPIGTATPRVSSTVTTTAVAHDTTTDYTSSLAICVGKTSTSVTVDAGTIRSEVFYGASAGHPYSSLVEYGGTKATRAFTSSTAGASGLGQQIALLDAAVVIPDVAYDNSFEGIADTTAVTTGNSGGASGDAFDAVSGTVVARTTSAFNGTRGAEASLAASTDSYVAWDVTGTTHYVRRYIKFASLPVTHNMRVMWGTSAGSSIWEIRLLFENNALDVTVGGAQRIMILEPPAAGIQAGVLYRIEGRFDSAAGAAELRVYEGHSATILASESWTGAIAGIDQVRFGNRSSSTITSTNSMDDVAYRNSIWPGPASYTNTAPTVSAGNDIFAEPWSTVTLTGTGSDDSGTPALSWVQLTGTSVTLGGSGAIRTFVAPPALSDQILTFRLTGSDGSLTSTDDVTVTILAVTECIAEGGAWRPAQLILHTDEF